MNVSERLARSAVVPVVVLDDAKDAVATATALLAGGVDVMEITFRTAAAADSIKAVAENCPDMLVGAGTVITLEQCKKAVEKDEETSVYSLGYKFVELASLYLNKIVLKTEAEPIMHTLAQILHATTYLGVLENNEVMYLQKTEQRNSLRLYTSIGKREPLYCTALGKVLLASLPLKEFEHVAQQLSYEPYTPNSITNYEDLAREVALVRKRGYATDRGEHPLRRGSCRGACAGPVQSRVPARLLLD